MTYRVIHTTSFAYKQSATLCHSEARLSPIDSPEQTCLESCIDVQPTPALVSGRIDHFGNRTTYFSIQEPHKSLEVTATSSVRVERSPDAKTACPSKWEAARKAIYQSSDWPDLSARQFVMPSPHIPLLEGCKKFACESFSPGRDLLDATAELNSRIFRDFKYVPGHTDISTPLKKVLEDRKGVCQDFAHLAIGCLRSIGIPARYVSGYVETIAPPGREHVVGADASHAWFAVYLPSVGWIDFDPTNNLRVASQHITVAQGRDFSDATPLKGVISGGGGQTVKVRVDVSRKEPAASA